MSLITEEVVGLEKPVSYSNPPLHRVAVQGKVLYAKGVIRVGTSLVIRVSEELNISLSSAEVTIRRAVEVGNESLQLFFSLPYTKDVAETKAKRLNDYVPPETKLKIEFITLPV